MEASQDQLKEQIEILCKQVAAQAAELQTKDRELEIEAALEKVRVRATAMRDSSELAETSAVLFQQLKELRIRAIRTGVGIFDDANDAMELWLTSYTDTQDVLRILDYVNLHIHPVFENIIPARQRKKPFSLTVLQGEEVKEYYQTMSTYFSFLKQKGFNDTEYFYSFFFPAGTINVVTIQALTEEECSVLTRFAQVFGLIYTRFLDLQKTEQARQSVESALAELKATQVQLIHSEKMASLGELTAGIAHEIQNPLNFVNNFAEVSSELLNEMKEELEKGNYQDAIAIAADVKENLQKINHHGRRADSIVKGMLQHSRASNGQKELTDINALCDEYLRLSYHGLRAKDKSFNAIMKTDFDERTGKIAVQPQDLGRVILNLLNNAFYAASTGTDEGDSATGTGKTPTVWVSTAREADKVLIRIKDNGPGIPSKILEKIFQPFYTTKPTGQGTGLGLSLSYDIVTKAHGGELKVDTEEGKYTMFTIILPF